MGDRAPGTVTVYECPVDKRPDAFEAISDFMTSIDYDEGMGTELALGVRYTDFEIRLGFEGDLGPQLEALGASYLIGADGKCEYDACVRMFTPSLGLFDSTASADDNTRVLIPASTVMDAIGATVSRDGLVERLMNRTGQAWFDYFDAVMKGQPAPTMAEMVAARNALSRIQEDLT